MAVPRKPTRPCAGVVSVSIQVGEEPVSPGVEAAREFQYFLLSLAYLPHVLSVRAYDEDFEHEVYG